MSWVRAFFLRVGLSRPVRLVSKWHGYAMKDWAERLFSGEETDHSATLTPSSQMVRTNQGQPGR